MVNGKITLYVSPLGSDTTGDGSDTKPFQTIGKVAQYYNSLVGVSYCTIYFMDGTYTGGVFNFYSRGLLTITSHSSDRNKVIFKNLHLKFNGSAVSISNITVDATGATSNAWPLQINCGVADLSNITVKGNQFVIVGILTKGGRAIISDSIIDNCVFALASEAGTNSAIGLSGSGNTYGYSADRSFWFVSNNSLVATTLKVNQNNGEVRGI